jgi:hypothetical protein
LWGVGARRWPLQCCAEKSKAQRKEYGTLPGAQKTEVADAHEAFGQYVQQEETEEPFHRQAQETLFVLVCRIAPAEVDRAVHQGREPLIGDGDAVRERPR